MWCGNRYILYLERLFFLHRHNFFYGFYGNKSLHFFLVTVPWYLSYMFTVMSSSSSLNSCPQMIFFTDLADPSPTRPNLSFMDGAINSNPVFLRLLLSTRWCVALHYGVSEGHITLSASVRVGIC